MIISSTCNVKHWEKSKTCFSTQTKPIHLEMSKWSFFVLGVFDWMPATLEDTLNSWKSLFFIVGSPDWHSLSHWWNWCVSRLMFNQIGFVRNKSNKSIKALSVLLWLKTLMWCVCVCAYKCFCFLFLSRLLLFLSVRNCKQNCKWAWLFTNVLEEQELE